MEDRISTYPGRVKLTPVEGQENTYDMERMDSPIQQGTPINKISLLKDATAALYGLGADAVPDDVLAFVGKYNEHWWSLLHGQAYSYTKYEADVFTDISADTSFYLFYTSLSAAAVSTSAVIAYSKTVSVSDDGTISLVDPTTITLTTANATESKLSNVVDTLVKNAPCYVTTTYKSMAGNVIYLPSGTTSGIGSSGIQHTLYYNYYSDNYAYISFGANGSANPRAQTVTSSPHTIQVPAGETTYEHSTDRNAYPDSGTVDSITYTYLGVPFDGLINNLLPNIETGSWAGTITSTTGVYSKTITFAYPPKFVYILGAKSYQYGVGALFIGGVNTGISIFSQGGATPKADMYNPYYVSWSNDNKTLTLSEVGHMLAFNTSEVTYNYVSFF